MVPVFVTNSFPLLARFREREFSGAGADSGAGAGVPVRIGIAKCSGEEEYPKRLCVHPDWLRTTTDLLSPCSTFYKWLPRS